MHTALRSLQGALACRQARAFSYSPRACSRAEGEPSPQQQRKAAGKRRLDELCQELYAEHSSRALLSWIAQGKVTVNGRIQSKAGTQVAADADIRLSAAPPRYVSRAGYKLEAALSAFGLSVQGLRVLDAGISTGGFTDCLLQHGAASVIGVDVGYGQVAERVRTDSRVTIMERTNLRTLQLQDLPGQQPCDLATLDLSFISLTAVLPAVLALLQPRAQVVALIKPQFEAERGQVEPGGLVTDAAVHTAVVDRVTSAAVAAGLERQGLCESPVPGLSSGNKEFLALFGHP